MQKFRITYSITPHDPPISREEIPDGHGATDAVIIVSGIYPKDGGYSQAMVTLDGRTGEPWDPKDLFKAWILMSQQIAEKLPQDDIRTSICAAAFEYFQCMMQQIKKEKEQDEDPNSHPVS